MTSPPHQSLFLRELSQSLSSCIRPEMELTVRVAVMSAGGCSRPEMLERLKAASPQVTETEVKMAMIRLQRITEMWKGATE